MYILVQCLPGIMLDSPSRKAIADVGIPFDGMLPAIDPGQKLGLELPGSFFAGFTNDRFDQAFVWLEVAGGLV